MQEMGKEKLLRQRELARVTCPHCFGQNGKHASLCPRGKLAR